MLNNLKIGLRLALGFGTVLVLLCAVAAAGLWQTRQVNEGAVQLGTNWLPSVKALGAVSMVLNDARRASLRQVLETDARAKQEQQALKAQRLDVDLKAALAVYEPLISSDEERTLYRDLQARLQHWQAAERRLGELANGGEAALAEARALAAGETSSSFTELLAALKRSLDLNDHASVLETEQAQATYERAKAVSLTLIAAGLLAGLGAAVLITRSITRPLGLAVQAVHTVAQGDLSGRVEVTGRDEVGVLLGSLAAMNDHLARTVGEVRRSSESIATAAAQIATGNADLSQRTEEQASNLQQTAASMEQLTGTVKNNADTSRQADQLAGAASAAASEGGRVMGQVIGTMQAITGSSKKIADIIGVIDGIAFQTNILALNAAVEAARAGEQGRGFAVVASEVRSLAQRSASAAREIKSLIGESVTQVENGSRLVHDAGGSIEAIVRQVQQVSDLLGEMSSATQEQSSGIEQVGHAVTELDKVTQQNAALVEESAAAAQSLRDQAGRLTQAVAVFRLVGA